MKAYLMRKLFKGSAVNEEKRRQFELKNEEARVGW